MSLQERSPALGWEIRPSPKEPLQAKDSWFWKSACIARGLRQAEDPALTNTTTSYTVSVSILRAAVSSNEPKPFVNQIVIY